MKFYMKNENEMDDMRSCLSPAELIEAKRNIAAKKGMNKELDEVSAELFSGALDQLESINRESRVEFYRERDQLDRELEGMKNGEERLLNVSYRGYDGQMVNEEIGVLKGERNRYFCMDYGQNGPRKAYISENDFNQRLSDSIRNKVKESRGIGDELYTLSAEDGSRFIIKDAMDDTEKANRFKDGFMDINMYHIGPDGKNTQMTKEDVKDMVEENGITKEDIEKGKTQCLALRITNIAAKGLWNNKEKIYNELKESMGLMTSTRA